jgi:hypothetical protein
MDARSIADVPEHELVELLLRDEPLRGMILSAAGANRAFQIHFRVPSAVLAADPTANGDVDLLVYEDSAPELAVAYEFKRVKIASHTFNTGSPNKLSQLSKAVRQANALERIGFSTVVLAILLVTDGRTRIEFNFAFRGATHDLLRTVDSAIDLSELHPDIGAHRFEVVQPLDRDFTMSGGVSVKAFRVPKIRPQPMELTQRIQAYASRAPGAR